MFKAAQAMIMWWCGWGCCFPCQNTNIKSMCCVLLSNLKGKFMNQSGDSIQDALQQKNGSFHTSIITSYNQNERDRWSPIYWWQLQQNGKVEHCFTQCIHCSNEKDTIEENLTSLYSGCIDIENQAALSHLIAQTFNALVDGQIWKNNYRILNHFEYQSNWMHIWTIATCNAYQVSSVVDLKAR